MFVISLPVTEMYVNRWLRRFRHSDAAESQAETIVPQAEIYEYSINWIKKRRK